MPNGELYCEVFSQFRAVFYAFLCISFKMFRFFRFNYFTWRIAKQASKLSINLFYNRKLKLFISTFLFKVTSFHFTFFLKKGPVWADSDFNIDSLQIKYCFIRCFMFLKLSITEVSFVLNFYYKCSFSPVANNFWTFLIDFFY